MRRSITVITTLSLAALLCAGAHDVAAQQQKEVDWGEYSKTAPKKGEENWDKILQRERRSGKTVDWTTFSGKTGEAPGRNAESAARTEQQSASPEAVPAEASPSGAAVSDVPARMSGDTPTAAAAPATGELRYRIGGKAQVGSPPAAPSAPAEQETVPDVLPDFSDAVPEAATASPSAPVVEPFVLPDALVSSAPAQGAGKSVEQADLPSDPAPLSPSAGANASQAAAPSEMPLPGADVPQAVVSGVQPQRSAELPAQPQGVSDAAAPRSGDAVRAGGNETPKAPESTVAALAPERKAALDVPASPREAAPKRLYSDAAVRHFMRLALYDSEALRSAPGGEAGAQVLVRWDAPMRVGIVGGDDAASAMIGKAVRLVSGALPSQQAGIELVPAEQATAKVFVLGGDGGGIDGYTERVYRDGTVVSGARIVVYRESLSTAVAARQLLAALGFTGCAGEGETLMRCTAGTAEGEIAQLPELDRLALKFLYHPTLEPGMDHKRAERAVEALR